MGRQKKSCSKEQEFFNYIRLWRGKTGDGSVSYEFGYFCINIRPTGGSYSDGWYVYANRNTFFDLYASLQSGSKNVILVAQMVYVDTGSNNMATLVDYKK